MTALESPDLVTAVATGDRRASLEAIRDHLAAILTAGTAGIAIGPIAKELRTVIAELDSLPGALEGSKSDELAAKRAKRTAERRATATS